SGALAADRRVTYGTMGGSRCAALRCARLPVGTTFRAMIQHISRRLQRARPSLVLFGGMLLAISACAPRVAPLTGAAVGEALPSLELEGSRRLVFRWRFADASIILQGEGVARVTAPDSARLDFFVDGGLG